MELPLIWLDPKRLTEHARFPPSSWGEEPWETRPDGTSLLGKYLDLFEDGRPWNPACPAILAAAPNGACKIVEGSRRLQAAARLGMPQIPVILCLTKDELAHALKTVYNLEPRPQKLIPCPPR